MAGGRPAGTFKQIDLGNGRFMVGLSRFATLCGVDKKSIKEAVERGDLSFKIRSNAEYLIWPDDKDQYLATARLYTQGRRPDNPEQEEAVLSEAIGTPKAAAPAEKELDIGQGFGSRADATSRKLRISAELLILDYKVRVNKLIEIDKIIPAVLQAATGTKNAMLSITPRVKMLLAAESDPDEVEKILNAEIRSALTNLDLLDALGKRPS